MKTDDLIAALAADVATPSDSAQRQARFVLPLATLAVGMLFWLFLGLRADIAASGVMPAIGVKLMLTLSLAGVGLAVLMAATRIGFVMPMAWLGGAGVIAAGVLASIDFGQSGLSGWQTRLIGSKGLHCLTLIPMLSIVPLVGALIVLRRGVVTQPMAAGAAAGLFAAGVAASFYALNCMDDSPLFVLFWYALASAIVIMVGSLVGRILLRW